MDPNRTRLRAEISTYGIAHVPAFAARMREIDGLQGIMMLRPLFQSPCRSRFRPP